MDIIAVSIGQIPIYWYGLTTSFAIAAGMATTWLHMKLCGGKFSEAVDILLWSIPLGFVFSRLFYIALHWPQYRGQWLEIVAVHHGGMSIYGAIAGFLLAVFFYAQIKRTSFWFWLDAFLPALLLGLAIDQLGHFVFQETIGMPDSGRITEYVEFAHRPSGFEGYEYFKPVALYQAMWQIAVFLTAILLVFLQRIRGAMQSGTMFLLCLALIGAGRFGFGFLYLTANPGGGYHFGQWAGLLCCVGCCALFIYRKCVRRHTRPLSIR